MTGGTRCAAQCDFTGVRGPRHRRRGRRQQAAAVSFPSSGGRQVVPRRRRCWRGGTPRHGRSVRPDPPSASEE